MTVIGRTTLAEVWVEGSFREAELTLLLLSWKRRKPREIDVEKKQNWFSATSMAGIGCTQCSKTLRSR
jgi:hypothetical protein